MLTEPVFLMRSLSPQHGLLLPAVSTGMSLADIRTILSNPDDHALSIDVMERARQKIEDEIVGLQQNLEHLDRRIQEHRRHLDSTR